MQRSDSGFSYEDDDVAEPSSDVFEMFPRELETTLDWPENNFNLNCSPDSLYDQVVPKTPPQTYRPYTPSAPISSRRRWMEVGLEEARDDAWTKYRSSYQEPYSSDVKPTPLSAQLAAWRFPPREKENNVPGFSGHTYTSPLLAPWSPLSERLGAMSPMLPITPSPPTLASSHSSDEEYSPQLPRKRRIEDDKRSKKRHCSPSDHTFFTSAYQDGAQPYNTFLQALLGKTY